MKKVLIILFTCCSFIPTFAQSEYYIQKEAYPNDPIVIDNSQYAQLWKALIEARESGDESSYQQIFEQIQQQYSNRLVGEPLSETDQVLLPVEKDFSSSNSLPEGVNWTDEIEIFHGKIGYSTGGNPTPNRKMIKLIADTLGILYAAFITNWTAADTLAIFKSTDKGFTWIPLRFFWSGPGLRYQGFDIAVADTFNGRWKIGMVVSLTSTTGNGYNGSIYYIDMNEDGTEFSPILVESAAGTNGCISPAIVTDAYDYLPALTYWYLTYQRVDTTTGATKEVIAALSSNGGTSWVIDTVRAGFNDYQLDIDYSKTDTFFVYVLLTNNITPTDENLRLRYINLGNFGTAAFWNQYGVAQTANPEYYGMLAVNRVTNQMAVVHTTKVGTDENIEYAYSLTGKVPFTMNVALSNEPNNETRASIHSPENQSGVFRVAFVSKGSSDTVYYKVTPNIASFSSSKTLVSRVNYSSSSVIPSVCGFSNNPSSGFNGGVIYAGLGPSNLYFNSSNLITDIEDNFVSIDNFVLYQNYPNPFNPTTKIVWQSPVSGWQTLKVYDMLGSEVATLVNEYRDAGRNEIEFDASKLSSGLYIYTLKTGGFISSKKMMLVK
ncbi:Peptidase S8/S53 subtilisin kexin sedolisin [Ignavibacterium album JCM 16511]|uniref:Peptidase S8/S53 subtilisin kexin sedolisin n=1 Tax=Ignavibacterium album (strain DSM 19864 / JCM 16511 / NBRC 101810 / Mat9-16) TaxID=945713 RepID=I0ALA7_IGNAJ|nr:T9SS type A sorting domain-containing protein [Ignavibacterium album]AFH49764.1 Peptidase S8/S53 subtilisin kexin sedolisin [Ignavibacterium album JCM 16511]